MNKHRSCPTFSRGTTSPGARRNRTRFSRSAERSRTRALCIDLRSSPRDSLRSCSSAWRGFGLTLT